MHELGQKLLEVCGGGEQAQACIWGVFNEDIESKEVGGFLVGSGAGVHGQARHDMVKGVFVVGLRMLGAVLGKHFKHGGCSVGVAQLGVDPAADARLCCGGPEVAG